MKMASDLEAQAHEYPLALREKNFKRRPLARSPFSFPPHIFGYARRHVKSIPKENRKMCGYTCPKRLDVVALFRGLHYS